MKRKKRWMLPVIMGFVVLYLMTMGLSTYLMGLCYQDAFLDAFRAKQAEAQQQLFSSQEQLSGADAAFREGFGRYLLGTLLNSGSGYQQFSAALYDTEGKKITETASSLAIFYGYSYEGQYEPFCWPAAEYLSEKEIGELAGYMDRAYACIRKNAWTGDASDIPGEMEEYRFTIYITSGTRRPFALVIQKIRWEQEGEAVLDPLTGTMHSQEVGGIEYLETEGEIVWQWGDPDEYGGRMVSSMNVSDAFPYIWDGQAAWKRWKENVYLQTLPETVQPLSAVESAVTGQAAPHTQGQREMRIFLPGASGESGYSIVLRMDSHPWLAALETMKYVYLSCLALMAVCMWKIIHVTDKVYSQQEALEEMRRDFTNAMAHELKTPLGIIRGFAENLLEGIQEEKREYYLRQIIGQTEEMDALTGEMITISRMDSEQLVLEKEPVSLGALIQEELEHLRPMMEEKHLQVQCRMEEAFVLEGDQGYLKRAVRNLLSNAVVYNQPGGRIGITVTAGCCTIENTAFPLSEEQLARAFEMFYQGDESRSKEHMGLGLYLAGRIFGLHGLQAKIGNTEQGVKVTVQKRS